MHAREYVCMYMCTECCIIPSHICWYTHELYVCLHVECAYFGVRATPTFTRPCQAIVDTDLYAHLTMTRMHARTCGSGRIWIQDNRDSRARSRNEPTYIRLLSLTCIWLLIFVWISSLGMKESRKKSVHNSKFWMPWV